MKVELPPEIEKFLPDFITDVGYCDYAESEEVLRRLIMRAILFARAETLLAVRDGLDRVGGHPRLCAALADQRRSFLIEAEDLMRFVRLSKAYPQPRLEPEEKEPGPKP